MDDEKALLAESAWRSPIKISAARGETSGETHTQS
jgi:hypothetical protein